jgi:Subtilase family/Peptidase inhibitor I9
VRRKNLWALAAAIPLVASGLWSAPAASAAQPTSAGQAPLTAAQASALSTNVTKRVIIVFKNQITADPASRSHVSARRSIEASEQQPILAELSQTEARNVHAYTTINAVAAIVSPGEQARIAANPDVAEVVPDQIINMAAPALTTPSATGTRNPVPGTCSSSPNHPELAPQALSLINADSSDPDAQTARSLGIDGSGVTVAYIADGVDINNPDFIRPDGQHVFVDYKDFTGFGTAAPTGGGEAFIDSSSIAAQGNQSYNISNYSALPLSRPCYVKVEGVAPGASLVGLIAFTGNSGFNSTILQAIDYAVSVDHVNVLNESFGANLFPDDQASFDLIKQADDEATAAGTTVTVSTGDAGVTNTTGSPADDPNLIGVGATTSYELDSQVGYGGFQFPGVKGYLNNNISSFSSSGFTQTGSVLSAVAPGELNWVLCTPNLSLFSECANFAGQATPVLEGGGTSESSPLTAGVAALVIQAYEKTHGGSAPTPALVKQFITSTADDINAPGDQQGSGLIDAYRAVLAAESYQASPPAGAENIILKSSEQFNAVAGAGTPESFTEQLTNLGSTTQRVNLASRTLGAYSTVKTATVTLSDTASPHSTDYQGINDNYETVNFFVPFGVDRLNGAIAFQGSSGALSARVRLALVDPLGRLAEYSVPQGVGNYGDVQVADPTPGFWTAYIWSRDSADGGTTGPVVFGASVASYQNFGVLSTSSLTLGPGATGSFTLQVSTPATPGDQAGSITITPPGQVAESVPVTLRSLAPSGPTSFSGVLTGGNGRSVVNGETEYYQVDVPAGAPALNASVTLADNPANQTAVWLIDPSGQAEAYQSNVLVTLDQQGSQFQNTLGTNLHVVHPAAGRWTLAIDFAPTVSGTALSEPFTVNLDQTAPLVQATGVPHGERINAKNPAVVNIQVTNTGTAPEAYFVDGRTDTQATYNLVSVTSPDTQAPLTFSDNFPEYLVPSQTTSITGEATTDGTEPIEFDMSSPAGDPDVASTQGTDVTATATGSPLTPGEWSILPSVYGPFTATAATTENTATSMTATTAAFDPAVSSPDTGDLWQLAIGGPFTITPVIVEPGQSATIPVTIAPTGPAGTRVSGVLYLDDDSLFLFGGPVPNADTVAAVPYSYRIK